MPLTKQQIAIKCSYEGRRKPGKPPRDRMVLDGRVKLTPRRREILFHVGCTDSLWWHQERDWSKGWKNHRTFVPYLGATSVGAIVNYLKRMKLVKFSNDGWYPRLGDSRGFEKSPSILLITPRGMDALLECVGGLP